MREKILEDFKLYGKYWGEIWREVKQKEIRSQGNKLQKYLLIESDEVSGKGNWKKF